MQRLLNQGWTAGDAPNKTRSTIHQLPSGTIGVRFELPNLMTDASVTYNAAFALSTGVGDLFTPLNASGEPDNKLWIQVTSGGDTAMTVAPAVAKNQPARLVTDLMPFRTVPPARLDGGSGVCLFFRLCAIDGRLTYLDVDGNVVTPSGLKNARDLSQFSQTFGGSWGNPGNNCVPGNFNVAYQANDLSPMVVPLSILPVMAAPVMTVMSVGDSILSGVSALGHKDAGINGVGLQLAKLLDRPHRTVLHVNEARSGMSSTDFIANARNTLAGIVPDVILLQTYSANDARAQDQEMVWQAWQRTMLFAAEATERGSVVVMLTSPPFCGTGSTRAADVWEDARLAANALVIGSNLPFVDSDKVVGIGDGPVGYLPGTSDDFVHPNEAGSGALARDAARILAGLGIA